jgi:hypothetical protein
LRFGLTLRIRPFHIADDGLPAVIHMNMFDADYLLPAMTQASKNLYLRRISPNAFAAASGLMLANVITFAHFSTSAVMNV